MSDTATGTLPLRSRGGMGLPAMWKCTISSGSALSCGSTPVNSS